MLINEEREENLRKSFLVQETTSSLVSMRVETRDSPLGRNDLFPRSSSRSRVQQGRHICRPRPCAAPQPGDCAQA
jgi:hypothetical protein